MTTRRQFLATTGATLAAGALRVSAAGASAEPLRFGLMADCQYVDGEPRKLNFYRESPRKLGEAISAMNQSKVGFSFHLGDLIDRDFPRPTSVDTIISADTSSRRGFTTSLWTECCSRRRRTPTPSRSVSRTALRSKGVVANRPTV